MLRNPGNVRPLKGAVPAGEALGDLEMNVGTHAEGGGEKDRKECARVR